MPTQQQLDNLYRLITPAAVTTELRTGIPADFTSAQCILESNWLQICPNNNCFGIKEYPGAPARQILMTREWMNDRELAWFLHLGDGRKAELVDSTTPPRADGRRQYRVWDWFAAFNSLEDCFAKRAALLVMGPYRIALTSYAQTGNVEDYTRGVAKIYATAPNYADILLGIMKQHDVQEAIYDARQQLARQAKLDHA